MKRLVILAAALGTAAPGELQAKMERHVLDPCLAVSIESGAVGVGLVDGMDRAGAVATLKRIARPEVARMESLARPLVGGRPQPIGQNVWGLNRIVPTVRTIVGYLPSHVGCVMVEPAVEAPFRIAGTTMSHHIRTIGCAAPRITLCTPFTLRCAAGRSERRDSALPAAPRTGEARRWQIKT